MKLTILISILLLPILLVGCSDDEATEFEYVEDLPTNIHEEVFKVPEGRHIEEFLPNIKDCNLLTAEEIISTCGETGAVDFFSYNKDRNCQLHIAGFDSLSKGVSFTLKPYNKHITRDSIIYNSRAVSNNDYGQTIISSEYLMHEGIGWVERSEKTKSLDTHTIMIPKANYHLAIGSVNICTMEQLRDLAVLLHNRVVS